MSAKGYQRAKFDVRFGSLADIAAYPHDVRFTPKSGHRRTATAQCLTAAFRQLQHGRLQLVLPSCRGQLHCRKRQDEYCGKTEGNTKSNELPCPSSALRSRLTFEM
jgi:hypothetical protein